LDLLAVEASREPGVRRVDVGVDPGAQGTEFVTALATEPLVVGALPVTGADVVAYRVAEDVIESVFNGDAAAGLADNGDDLTLVVDALAAGKERDLVVGVGQRVVRLDEELR